VKGLGFSAEIRSKEDRNIGEILAQIQPEDLIKFGMIPEFMGRIPIIASLSSLSEEALVRILTEPKNALIKQYKKLFEVEGVDLKFTEEAIRSISRDAIKKKSGARGLRAILESVMLDIMYDIPGMTGIRECVIGEAVINGKEQPLLVYENKAGYA
jgi:ATP-dependent Clp protease ATP-binding subunit ClpX